MDEETNQAARQAVAEHYAEVARGVSASAHASASDGASASASAGASANCCCGGSSVYAASEIAGLPTEALRVARGCADPHAFAQLKPGEVVLDLGSGGGIDCLLAAREVGDGGQVVGLDMTPEMIELAQTNAILSGSSNVSFVQGYIEDLPFSDRHFDVVISNCVINLSTDKPAVLKEAFRVLKPGGRFAVADVVGLRSLPEQSAQQLATFLGCTSGVLLDQDYQQQLQEIGFADVTINVTQVYSRERLEVRARQKQLQAELYQIGLELADGAMAGAVISARKPG